jgi:hypothetical protein
MAVCKTVGLAPTACAQGSARRPDLTCAQMVGAEWEQRSAVNCAQTRSDAVIVLTREALTCCNVLEQRFCLPAHSVRDEEAAGSVKPSAQRYRLVGAVLCQRRRRRLKFERR